MNRTTNDSPASAPSSQPVARRRRRFAGLAIAGVASALLAGTVAAWSHNHEGPGWHGGGRWCKAAAGPEAQRQRVEFATDWVLSKVDANESQRTQVKAIVQSAVADLMPLREQHRANREAFVAAMAQPSIDRAALEQLRRDELQLAEQASSRMVTALADAAEVLTPEQRSALARLAESFRRHD